VPLGLICPLFNQLSDSQCHETAEVASWPDLRLCFSKQEKVSMDSEISKIEEILLVEDDPLDVELTLAALKENHFANKVAVVSDGEEALDYLYCRGKFEMRRHGNPLIVFLDHMLPKITGLEVLKIMKADEELKLIPIVALTSSREPSDLAQFYKYGVNAYAVKPVNFLELLRAVKHFGFFWAAVDESPTDSTPRSGLVEFGYREIIPQKAVIRRRTANDPSPMQPTYFMLMFSKSEARNSQYFRVYIELRDQDKALFEGVLSDALKSRLLVERVGILDLLPNGLNDDWPDFGTVIERNSDSFWHMGIPPTTVKGHNVWIIDGG
jgi:CheY-like chemotaxis protein